MTPVPFYRRRGLQVAVSALLLVALAWRIEWPSVVQFLARANPWLLGVLMVVIPLDRVFMAWKWRLLAVAQGGLISVAEAIRIYLLSGLSGVAIPLGGVGPDIVRVSLLSQHGMPTSVSVPSIMVERLVGLMASLIMLATGTLLGVMLLGGERFPLDRTQMLTILGVVVFVMLAAGLFVAFKGRDLARAPALVRRVGLAAHWEVLTGFADHRRLLAVSVLLAWVEQWASVVTFYIACVAFDIPLSFLACAALIPVASILERLPVSAAGIGVKEAGIVYMAGLFGVPFADAFLVSLTCRLIYLATLLALNLASLIIPSRRTATSSP